MTIVTKKRGLGAGAAADLSFALKGSTIGAGAGQGNDPAFHCYLLLPTMQSDTAFRVMKNTFLPKAPFFPCPGQGHPEGVWLRQSWLCSVHKWSSLTNVNIQKAKLPGELQGQTLHGHAYGYAGGVGKL